MKAKQLLLALLGSAALSVSATAAIVGLADATLTGTQTEVYDVTDIAGEDSIYIAGTMTFNAVDDTQSVVLTEVQINGIANAYRFGQLNGTASFANIKPSTVVLDDELTVGESHSVVLKMNTLTGAFSLWMDPNLALTEASTVADITSTNANGAGTLEQVQFRSNGSADADFTDFALYTGSNTPFAVPEPGSLALLGLVGLALILRRRK